MTVKQRLFQQSRGCNSKINNPIWIGFALIWEFIHLHLSCKFLNEFCSWQSETDTFSAIKGHNSKINRFVQFLNSSKISSASTLSASFMKIWLKLNESCWSQSKQRLFQQSKCYNSKINDPICPGFDLIWNFIPVKLICKFQEDPIKTIWATLMKKSNRGFFSNQEDTTLRLMIRSGQFSNSFAISSIHPCPSYLQVSETSN